MAKSRKAKKRKRLRDEIKVVNRQIRDLERQRNGMSVRLTKLSKMKPGGGRSKGNSFENQVAKLVRAAFGLPDDACYRTPLSGGHRFAKNEDPGDLVLSKKALKVFPFSVECKCYKKVDLHPLWLPQKKWGKSWEVKSWLKQSVFACAKKLGVQPIVVFKQNKGPVLAILPSEAMPSIPKRWMEFRYMKHRWCVTNFNDLLKSLASKEAV
jgi:hypothetical protein